MTYTYTVTGCTKSDLNLTVAHELALEMKLKCWWQDSSTSLVLEFANRCERRDFAESFKKRYAERNLVAKSAYSFPTR